MYHVRFCVPERLKDAVGKGELHRSTGCRELHLAKIIATEMAAQWHRSIEDTKNMDISKLKAGSVDLIGDGFISLIDAANACGANPTDLACRLQSASAGFFVQADKWLGWHTADIHSDVSLMRDGVSGCIDELVISEERLGGASSLRSHSGIIGIWMPELLDELFNRSESASYVSCFVFPPSVNRGFVLKESLTVTLSDLLVKRLDVRRLTTMVMGALPRYAIEPASVCSAKTVIAKADGQLFSEVCSDYFKHNGSRWKKSDHPRRIRQSTQFFLDLIEDLPVVGVKREHIRKFVELIRDIPANRNKVAAQHDLDANDILRLIELKRKSKLSGLSIGETRKIVDHLTQVLDWALTEGIISSNPAARLGDEVRRNGGVKRRKASEERSLFADDELSKIFCAHWFQTGKGAKTAKGVYYHFRPHYYWLPLMGLYTGARLNELSQLYLKDIVICDGVYCLDLNLVGEGKVDADVSDPKLPEASDKSLKTVSAERKVPIHSKLIELGFLSYVEVLRSAGYTRLFEELTLDLEKGYGKAAGKWFNDRFLSKEIGIKRDGTKTFHSLRHHFASALGRTGIPSNWKADLMGHSRIGTTGEIRYEKPNLADEQKYLEQVTYTLPSIAKFDVEEGLVALQHAIELKSTRKASHLRHES